MDTSMQNCCYVSIAMFAVSLWITLSIVMVGLSTAVVFLGLLWVGLIHETDRSCSAKLVTRSSGPAVRYPVGDVSAVQRNKMLSTKRRTLKKKHGRAKSKIMEEDEVILNEKSRNLGDNDNGRNKTLPEIKINDTGEVIMTDSATKLTLNQTTNFLQFHNNVRRQVNPVAANMKLLTWDNDLAEIVARRATTCMAESSRDDENNLNVGYSNDDMGMEAMENWVKENNAYQFDKKTCTSRCTRYTRMVWAATDKLGCALQKCGVRHIVVCAYETKGNQAGEHVYQQGPPCSLCPQPWELCFRNLCVKAEVCHKNKIQCECKIKKCYNCGVLNEKGGCFCDCKIGFDGADCSLRCVNDHPFCGRHPGFTDLRSCQILSNSVRDAKCRKMCGRCRALEDDRNPECCDGKECSIGAALDEDCHCVGICPGPECGSLSSSIRPNVLLSLVSTIANLVWQTSASVYTNS